MCLVESVTYELEHSSRGRFPFMSQPWQTTLDPAHLAQHSGAMRGGQRAESIDSGNVRPNFIN
jgi:hypothetical protein